MFYRLSFLHLSDLHECVAMGQMGPEQQRQIANEVPARNHVLGQNLRVALDQVIKVDPHPIDFVCMTGDVAQCGERTEYDAAQRRLNEVLNVLGVPSARFFPVPGNHDVRRGIAKFEWEKILALAGDLRRADGFSKWAANTPSDEEDLPAKWRDNLLERTAEYRAWVTRQRNDDLLSPARSPHTQLGYSVDLASGPVQVQIIGLDSAWLSGDGDDYGRLRLTRHQWQCLAPPPVNSGPSPTFRLALVHHPLEFFGSEEASLVRDWMSNYVDLLIHGHLHVNRAERMKEPDRELQILAAGALYAGHQWHNSFHRVDVLVDSARAGTFAYRITSWAWDNGRWLKRSPYQQASDGQLVLESGPAEFAKNFVKAENALVANAPLVQPAGATDVYQKPNALLSFLDEALALHTKVLNSDDFFWRSRTGNLTTIVREPRRANEIAPFLYSEVTGYALIDLLFTSAVLGQDDLARATEAAGWLVGSSRVDGLPAPWHDDGYVKCRRYLKDEAAGGEEPMDKEGHPYWDSFGSNRVFLFDCAIVLMGLTKLWRQTCSEELWLRIVQLGESLIRHIGDDGSLPAVVRWNGVRWVDEPRERERWSRQSGAYHAKIAEALVELLDAARCRRGSQACGDLEKRCEKGARRICDYALTRQHDNGRFETSGDGDDARTELHPHMYAAEGLLCVGERLGEPRYVQAALDATCWALEKLSDSDECLIPQVLPDPPPPRTPRYRVDAVAQVVRLASQLEQRGLLPQDTSGLLDRAAKALFVLQDKKTGVFPYGFDEDGKPISAPGFWTQHFAFQAQVQYVAAWVSRRTALVMLAGGEGTRCWPISTTSRPKPFSYAFLGDRSLAQETCQRFVGLVPPVRMHVACERSAQRWAQKQMPALPRDNFALEDAPLHPIDATQAAADVKRRIGSSLRMLLARSTLTSGHSFDILIVSHADELFRPVEGFLWAALRGALACLSDSARKIVCVAQETQARNPRLGVHHFQRERAGLAPAIIFSSARSGGVTADGLSPAIPAGVRLAHDVGCTIWRRDEIVAHTQNGDYDLAAALATHPGYTLSLLPPLVRFADVGVPTREVIDYFAGTPFDRGNRVIMLGVRDANIEARSCRDLLVVVDRGLKGSPRKLSVVDVSNVSVLLSDHAWGAVIVPLDEPDEIPSFREMTGKHPRTTAYSRGGSTRPDADGQGSRGFVISVGSTVVDLKSDWGIAAAAGKLPGLALRSSRKCVDLRGRGSTELEDCDVDLLLRVQDDDVLVRHLLAVTHVGEWIATSLAHSDDNPLRSLLHRALLYHDIGGVLSGKKLETERRILEALRHCSSLWLSMDRTVVRQVLVRAADTLPQRPSQEELEQGLELLNDSVSSACFALENDEIASVAPTWTRLHRDALLYVLANQELATRFRTEDLKQGLAGIEDATTVTVARIQEVWAILQTAEQWVNLNSSWKHSLHGRSRYDIAEGLTFLCAHFKAAGLDPRRYLDQFSGLERDKDMSKYTRDELLEKDTPSGRDLWPSDKLLFKLLNRESPSSADVGEAYAEACQLGTSQGDALGFLRELPGRLVPLGGTLVDSRHVAALDKLLSRKLADVE